MWCTAVERQSLRPQVSYLGIRHILLTWINLNLSMDKYSQAKKSRMKLVIHSQTSTAATLKFGNVMNSNPHWIHTGMMQEVQLIQMCYYYYCCCLLHNIMDVPQLIGPGWFGFNFGCHFKTQWLFEHITIKCCQVNINWVLTSHWAIT